MKTQFGDREKRLALMAAISTEVKRLNTLVKNEEIKLLPIKQRLAFLRKQMVTPKKPGPKPGTNVNAKKAAPAAKPGPKPTKAVAPKAAAPVAKKPGPKPKAAKVEAVAPAVETAAKK